MRTEMRLLAMVCLVAAGFALLVSPASALGYRLVEEEILGPGITLFHYDLDVSGNTLPARQVLVDLRNSHVRVGAMSPERGFNHRETVRKMAARLDAVVAINADLFHMTRPAAPFGLHIEEGEILSSPFSNARDNTLGIDEAGTARIDAWPFRGRVYINGISNSLDGYNQSYQYNDDGIFLYDSRWGGDISGSFFSEPVVAVTVKSSTITRLEVTSESVNIPSDGFILVGEGEGAEFLNQIARVGGHVDYDLGLASADELKAAVAGHSLIVDSGLPLPSQSLASPGSTRASRSALGVDREGRILRLVTVDATGSSAGITMEELALFMSRLGSDRAINLDGGGSTTMVARPLGEFTPVLASSPRTGFERAVTNGIGIFNTARPSAPDRLFVYAPRGMLAGTEAPLRVTGHDANYLPIRITEDDLHWDVSDGDMLDIEGLTVRAHTPGEARVRVSLGSVDNEFELVVFGGEDIADILVTPTDVRMLPDQRVSLSAQVLTNTGERLDAGSDIVTWASDFGYVEGNTYHAPAEEGFGILTAEIDGYVKEVPIRVGGRREPFFTFREWQTTSFRSYPEGLPGNFEVNTDPEYIFRGERSGRLSYEFPTEGAERMIAYGNLGSGQISMGTNNVGISAYVLGDASGYELRADVVDNAGRAHEVALAESVDWDGWRRVQGAVDPSWPQPLILSSVSLLRDGGRIGDDAPSSGEIHVDYIEMIKGLDTGMEEEMVDVRMWVGSTNYAVRGQAATMDAAPFIESGRTLIPVRYLAEAFEAHVDWTPDPETGLTSTVTLTAEDKLIFLTIGVGEMTVADRQTGNGVTHELDVPPMIVEGRTYLPFRAIGETGFGATVDYSLDPGTGLVDCVWLNR
ncbi:MAG: phosphodiester glycosidase family protein [Bacillota bacterium]